MKRFSSSLLCLTALLSFGLPTLTSQGLVGLSAAAIVDFGVRQRRLLTLYDWTAGTRFRNPVVPRGALA